MSRAGRAELAGHLARWLFPGGGVAVAVAWQGDALRPLAPAEAEAVRSAFPKRRREFALGRHCAHLALDGIERPAPALAVGPDRGPLWPEGATGSISHSGGMAIAAATRRRPGTGIGTGDGTGIGLDIEHRSGVLPRATWHLVFSAAERARLACPGPLGAADRAHLWFSAKESSFKALAAATGERPPLARLEIGEDAQGMPVAVTLAGTPWRCRIRHVVTAQRLITSAVLEPPACRATEAPCPEVRPS